ncbi:alpha/beta fold hydrolase [Naasia lichenicola]|uniref:alpha/beta fold hydrolase n=1 Tax=Naasia lichenicola TaxID=2565933 RepID=UPI00130E8350|nr:alpha/beta hydrolase [Naasia lichenicola]
MLLHGVGLSHREYSRLARVLRETGPVIAFDLPGFGPSRRPLRDVSIEENARRVAQALDARNVRSSVVVGHSMGAQFAVELAATRPDLVSHLVLIGPVVDPAHPTLRGQARALLRDWPLEPPLTQLMAGFDYARSGVRWFLAQSIVMRDFPTHVRIHAVEQPLLVLRGAHDPIAKPPWVDWLARQVRLGEVVTVEGHRHNVVHSGAEEVASAILRFVAP